MTLKELQAKHDELQASLAEFQALEDDSITAEMLETVQAQAEEFETVKADLKAAKIEAAKQANSRISGLLASQNTGGTAQPANEPQKVTVPAQARSRRQLKAFESEEQAYCAGHWMAANIWGHSGSQKWLEDHRVYDTAYSENNDQKGGVFVPNEISTNIVRLVESFGVARRECRVEPMGSDTKTVPVRTSGMTAHFVGESDSTAETGTASSADYKPCNLVVKKLKARTRVSDELNMDALVSIAEIVALESAQAIADKEDDCLFNGDGGATYGGITGLKSAIGAGGVFQMGAGDGSFADITLADLDSTMALLPDYPGMQPKWYVSKYGWYAGLNRLLNAAGGNTNQTLANGVGPNYNGHPVVWSQKLFGAAGDTSADEIIAFFGDLSMGVLFGDRQTMTLAVDASVAFEEDQIAIKAVERFDIKCHSVGDATNAGAVVALKTDIA